MIARPRRFHPLPLLLVSALTFACGKAKPTGSTTTNAGSASASGSASGTGAASASGSGAASASGTNSSSLPADGAVVDLDSHDILARTDVAQEAQVKHVLIAWKDLADVYRGRIDPRAAQRSNADAAALAKDVYGKLKADPTQIDALVKQYSEDPGSLGGDPYVVSPSSRFVPEFKNLALRLKVGEVGIVKTVFGYHVIERVAPPAPDPLESSDILARPAEPGTVIVQHVLIGWKDVPAARQAPLDPRAASRSKADADKLAKEILDKVRGGADMAALMKQYSEDPGTKDSGGTYDVNADAPLVDSFKNLSLRLKVGEAGMVISPFGWHVIKRVPPPPPDPLESADILARQPVTQTAQVKHILLGWAEVHPPRDDKGAKRSRADLEKLVKDTVAKLKGGAKIEPLMKELSEDPGSAASGEAYPVSADAQLVEPFKNLSLRLKVGEVGVVKSEFGMHIIQRVQ